jgi:hypothetical protein
VAGTRHLKFQFFFFWLNALKCVVQRDALVIKLFLKKTKIVGVKVTRKNTKNSIEKLKHFPDGT